MNPDLYGQLNATSRPDKIVMFFSSVVENPRKSKEQGWKCYDERLMIRAFAAGADGKLDGDYVDSVASPQDVKTYQKQYELFVTKNGKSDGFSGTLLRYLPFLSLARIEEWRTVGVFTVEQLAEVPSDTNLGASTASEVEQAKAWLQSVKDTAIVTKQAARVAELESELATAKEEVEELKSIVKELEKKKKANKDGSE